MEAGKYQLVEWRISIYGRKKSEWSSLANWFYSNQLSHSNIRWLIQIPRLFKIYKENNDVNSFHEMVANIFVPLIEVTLNPSKDIALHYFLQAVVGIDSVDDESLPENYRVSIDTPNPTHWNMPMNPPYEYWMYYLYANLCSLNQLRAERGLCTFQFRPHCGEAGLNCIDNIYIINKR